MISNSSALKFAVGVGIISSILSFHVYAQSAGSELKHFTGEGISFDYPSGYSVTEESTPEAQQFVIKRKGSSVALKVALTRRLVLRKDLPAAAENFTEPLLREINVAVSSGKNSPERTLFETQIGTKQAKGIRLRSRVKTGEVIWVQSSLRLLGLAFVKLNADQSIGAELWQTVSSSLKIDAPVLGVMIAGDEPTIGEKIEGGVLNGKAIALPKPTYPALARAAQITGTVTVQVVIDEQGYVSSAHAVDRLSHACHPCTSARILQPSREKR